jgi:hypothetical protein
MWNEKNWQKSHLLEVLSIDKDLPIYHCEGEQFNSLYL